MENKKELLVWKHKLPLDRQMLDRISEFYNVNVDESAIGVECFSHPSLNAHECNPAAKLAGGTACQFCNHIFERSCQITCNISRFCLAVFAYRIGIGGDDFERALQHNGQMDYEKLYKLVQGRLNDLEHGGSEVPVKDDLQLSLEFRGKRRLGKNGVKRVKELGKELAKTVSKNSSRGLAESLSKNSSSGEIDEDWITISSAAELYGCSYVNVYNHLRKGNLKSAKIKGTKHVRKSEVLKLKELNGK